MMGADGLGLKFGPIACAYDLRIGYGRRTNKAYPQGI